MLDDTSHNLPATIPSLSVIVEDYDKKLAAIPATVLAFKAAVTAVEMASTIGGTYLHGIWERGTPSTNERTLNAHLLESSWRYVYNGLNIDKIAPASDRSKFALALKDPAPFTLGNISATFGKYVEDQRGHILRGLAEAFGQLDQSFKSHDTMKIGVKGLPKRVILSSVTTAGYGGYGTERLLDMLNALSVYCGAPHITHGQLSNMINGAKGGHGRLHEVVAPVDEIGDRIGYSQEVLGGVMPGVLGDVWLKRFANGNGHLFFGPSMLAAVNKALREHYGEVLPDCPEAAPKRAQSTEVSKDLQFYATPQAVADEIVDRAYPSEGARILEPSCGDGSILEAVRRFAVRKGLHDLRCVGVEVDAARAAASRTKGFSVHTANFLQITPKPDFDIVIMNPPFYGKHYQKHVEHARKFLKPGGRLFAVLPITAVVDHGYIDPGRGWDKWKDLPPGSFSKSGTNINTGIAIFGPA
jgi:hypothetical protein